MDLGNFNQKIVLLKRIINENKEIIDSYEYSNSEDFSTLSRALAVVFVGFLPRKDRLTNFQKNKLKELYLIGLNLKIQDLVLDEYYKDIIGENPPEENTSFLNSPKPVNTVKTLPALSSGGSSPIEVDEMLKTIIEKAKALGMSPKEYMTSPNGLNVPESEAPHLHDSLECLELIHSNNGQNQVGMFGNAPKGGRKRYKKQTYKKRKGNKRTRRH
jgi:hypothetical protein